MKAFSIFTLILLSLTQLAFSQMNEKNIRFGSNPANGKYAMVGVNKIYYETYGKGTPLLLIHGGIGSISAFEKCIPTLASKFKVIALDSPGHGRSGKTDSLSYQFLANSISEFIDYLKLDSLYVMGWSDGGVIALILAADRPDKIKKIIAVGANSRLDGMVVESIAWTRNEMINALKNDKDWMRTYTSLMPEPENIDNFIRDSQKMWLTEIYIPQAKIESIKIPAMLVIGDRDEIKVEHVTALYHQIKNSQLCILPNTSHFVFSERADLINEIAIVFFNKKVSIR